MVILNLFPKDKYNVEKIIITKIVKLGLTRKIANEIIKVNIKL